MRRVDVVPGARLADPMIQCRHCEQWFVPGDPRTTMLTVVNSVPLCQHPGLRLATADEIAAKDAAKDAGPRCGWG